MRRRTQQVIKIVVTRGSGAFRYVLSMACSGVCAAGEAGETCFAQAGCSVDGRFGTDCQDIWLGDRGTRSSKARNASVKGARAGCLFQRINDSLQSSNKVVVKQVHANEGLL